MLEIKPIFNALRRSKVGAILLFLQIALTTAVVSNAAFMINDHLSYLKEDTGFVQQEIFSFGLMTFGKDIDLHQQAERDEDMIRDYIYTVKTRHPYKRGDQTGEIYIVWHNKWKDANWKG